MPELETARREIRQEVDKPRREGQEKPLTSLSEFASWVQEHLFFLDYAPVIFTSAKSGFHLDRLLETIRFVAAQLQQKVPTAILNRTLHDATAELGAEPVVIRSAFVGFQERLFASQDAPRAGG